MPRAVSIKQVKELSESSPDNGDVLTWSSSSGKYEPAPPGAGSIQIIVTDSDSGNVVTDSDSGDVVWDA